MKKAILFFIIFFILGIGLFSYANQTGQSLTFEERIAAQRAIEKVYYQHRIWPEENIMPKPAFEEAISDQLIREKVEIYLKKSVLLRDYWQRPLTGEQLQDELSRMISHSKDPETLQELFAALKNNPFLIAECLVRPSLADRLIRNWFAYDDRIHGPLKEQVDRIKKELTPENFFDYPEGQFNHIQYCIETDSSESPTSSKITTVDRETFDQITALFPTSPHSVSFREERRAFVFRMTILHDNTMFQGVVRTFQKQEFNEWFEDIFERYGIAIQDTRSYAYTSLPSQKLVGDFEPDTWSNDYFVPMGRIEHKAVWTGTHMVIWGGLSSYGYYPVVGGKYNPSTDTWTETSTSNAPLGRAFFTTVWSGSEVLIWGGYSDFTYLNSGGRYNPELDEWTAMTTVAPDPRYSHSAVWTGEEMIIWGGRTSGGVNINTGGRYNPSSDLWVSTDISDPDVAEERYYHQAVWTGEEMIVWGGENAGQLNTGARYNPSSDSWESMTTLDAPSARYHHSAAWTGEEMIIWGGGTAEYNDNNNDGSRYDPSTDIWQSMNQVNAPSPRLNHTGIWTGDSFIVWGGANLSTKLNTGGIYDPVLDSWQIINPEGTPVARSQHTAVWTGDEMIVWGGQDAFRFVESGGRFNPSLHSANWIATNQIDAPTGRYRHSTVWTGTEMIVWGGVPSTNSGARYNPVSDSWMQTTLVGAPSARDAHSAIWTGSEMVIWGGYYNPTYFDDGGKYDPDTDSWSTTSTVDCPSGRRYHSAVWTGTEMIVWGGYPTTITGGRYDPVTDDWQAMTTINAPAERYLHSAIWTGTAMVIWGGYPYTNTGSRYFPSTNNWSATDIVDAPSARRDHSAVWTGSRMIVWGGQNGSTYLNTGSIYNPYTDSWTVTSTVQVPETRIGHSAVWTGSEMIVWGGFYNDGTQHFINTGGHYDPYTDTWTLMMTGGVPTGRYRHSTVWTGKEIIVWGGYNGSSYLNTGGRYNPGYGEWNPVFTNDSANRDLQHSVIWTGSEMIVWGGASRDETTTLGEKYDPALDTWSALNDVDAPHSRVLHKAVWTGDTMVIWGGGDGMEADHNSGGRYNVSTDSWLSVNTASAPLGRVEFTAVWSGSEMLVWGGESGLSELRNRGGRYNPSTDSWLQISTVNAPEDRMLHSAVWREADNPADSCMIIWGGTGGSYHNTGGRYYPSTDTWLATSTNNAPEARFRHTAVWSGTEMIVWGGQAAGGVRKTGCRYNPVSDSWITIIATDAPGARTEHTAIWTGTEMIVWGGSASTYYYDTGGRYDPITNSWIDLPLDNAPTERRQHEAVWTGQSMIIQGGIPASSLGIFYPNTEPIASPEILNENQTIVLTDPPGEKLRLSQSLPMGVLENFETVSSWSNSGVLQWHRVDDLSCPVITGYYSPTHAYYCGDTANCNYADQSGMATLYNIDFLPVKNTADDRVILSFRYFLETDSLKNDEVLIRFRKYSPTTVYIIAEDESHWSGSPIRALNDSCSTWQTVTIDLEDFVSFNPGDSVRIYISFNSDGVDDSTLGFLIDDFSVGHPVGDGSNPSTTTPYHDQWDSGIFDWDLNRDGMPDNPDPTTPVWEIDQESLEDYNIYKPGDYTLTLNVTDLLGYNDRQSVLLTVVDGVPPSTTIISPNGGESWIYSPDVGNRKPHFLVWESADNHKIARTKLSYSTYYGLEDEKREAYYDSDYRTAMCNQLCSECDSGDLFIGRDTMTGGNEPNQPNTIGGTCADGTLGTYGVHNSIDRVRVYTLDGSSFAPDDEVEVEVSFWAYKASPSEYVDVYYTDNADSPSWTYIDSLGPFSAGWSVLTTSYFLPSGELQAVRAQIREGGTLSPCTSGDQNDRDDLIFKVGIDTMWTCIADSAEIDCDADNYSGIDILKPTDTNFLWEMPTEHEAYLGGQIIPSPDCIVKVDVFDYSDNTNNDSSDNSFYIVQPTTTGVNTLILWNSARICSEYDSPINPSCSCSVWSGDADCTITNSLYTKLNELADHEKVSGILLDLDAVPSIQSAYTTWDSTPLDPPAANVAAANAVATEIRNYILNQLLTYSNARYLILVGDDVQIPFYRMIDGLDMSSESDYSTTINQGGVIDTTVGASTADDKFLTDNFYSELNDEPSNNTGNPYIYQNDLSIGRLVETVEQMTETINIFLSNDGQVEIPTASDKIFVSGWDFGFDSAENIKDHFVSEGKTTECLLDDPEEILNSDPCIDLEFDENDLSSSLFSNPPHKVNVLHTHANHFTFQASTAPTDLTATDMAAASDLEGTVFYTLGCHTGYPVTPDGDNPLDIPEVMLEKGVLAYIANTGYGWGLNIGSGLSERLTELITDQILNNDSISIGRALGLAKLNYFLEDQDYDDFDEKVLHEMTLFGIPNTIVLNSVSKNYNNDSLPPPDGPDQACVNGICLSKKLTKSGDNKNLPPGVTQLDLIFTFESSTYQLNSEITAGDYYTLNGLSDSEVGHPIQPKFVYEAFLHGTQARGVYFAKGLYREHDQSKAPFDPVIATPNSTEYVNGNEGPFPLLGSFTPRIQISYGTSGGSAQKAVDQVGYTNMVVNTGYFIDTSSTEYLFDEMQFTIYYSNSSDVDPPSVTDPGSGGFHDPLGSDLTAHFTVEVNDGAGTGVYRVVIVYNDWLDEAWKSLDLTYNSTAGNWQGDLPVDWNISYYVRAVDNAGNIGTVLESGSDVDSGLNPFGSIWVRPTIYEIQPTDSDFDQMPDAYEDQYACLDSGTPDANSDPDYDYLTSLDEMRGDTNPCFGDTDNGGDNDGSELNNSRDPLVQTDDKHITIDVTKAGTTYTVDWNDSLGDNGLIDGYYFVYRSNTPHFVPGDNVYGPIANGVTSQDDVDPPCDPCYYKVWNFILNTQPPIVDVVVPGYGPAGVATAVVIYGQHFQNGATVTFCGDQATNVVVESENRITCTTPVRSAGWCDVTVENLNDQDGTLTNGFEYQ